MSMKQVITEMGCQFKSVPNGIPTRKCQTMCMIKIWVANGIYIPMKGKQPSMDTYFIIYHILFPYLSWIQVLAANTIHTFYHFTLFHKCWHVKACMWNWKASVLRNELPCRLLHTCYSLFGGECGHINSIRGEFVWDFPQSQEKKKCKVILGN